MLREMEMEMERAKVMAEDTWLEQDEDEEYMMAKDKFGDGQIDRCLFGLVPNVKISVGDALWVLVRFLVSQDFIIKQLN